MDITILHKLTYLNETKGLIKDSLNQFEAGITDEDTFRSYADKISDIYVNWRKVKDTGSNITLTPTLKGRLGSVLKGDTFQQTYTGKNLAKTTNCNITDTNYSYVINNGNIQINTTTTNVNFDICGGIVTGQWAQTYSNATDYHLTNADNGNYVAKMFVNEVSGTGTANCQFKIFTNQRDINTYFTPTTLGISLTKSLTLDQDEYIKQIAIWVNGSDSLNLKCNIQLESGSSATSYEPYVGGQASPNPDYPQDIHCVEGIQNISVYGKNLFDKSSVITGKYYSATGTLTDFTNGYGKLIDVIENTKYSLKIDNNYSSTIRLMVFVYDKDMNRLAQIRWGDTLASESSYTNQNYTMPNGAKYIGISVLDMQPTTENINKIPIQLEVGSTATTYEAYKGNTYEVNLGSIKLYNGDYITGIPDNWSVVRNNGRVVLDGSNDETWTFNNDKKRVATPLTNGKIFGNIKANMFTMGSGYNDTTINTIYIYANDYCWIYLDGTQFTDLSSWKTYLSSHNLEIIYKLATPTTTPITDTTLISQLNNVYNLKSYNDTTNISVEGNLPMILEVSALMKGSE